MFNSAVRTLKAHRIGPGARQGRVVNVKLKINRLSGFAAPTNEITHRVAMAQLTLRDGFDSRREAEAPAIILDLVTDRSKHWNSSAAAFGGSRGGKVSVGFFAPS